MSEGLELSVERINSGFVSTLVSWMSVDECRTSSPFFLFLYSLH